MGFVNINEAQFSLAELLKVGLKALDVRLAFLWVRLTQQLLALFPTEAIRMEQIA